MLWFLSTWLLLYTNNQIVTLKKAYNRALLVQLS